VGHCFKFPVFNFFPFGYPPPPSVALWPHMSHDLPMLQVDDTSQPVELLWTSDQPVTETSTWQHTILGTDIYSPDGIRTRNTSKPAAPDPRLRPCGHRDRQLGQYQDTFLKKCNCQINRPFYLHGNNIKQLSKKIVLSDDTKMARAGRNMWSTVYSSTQTVW